MSSNPPLGPDPGDTAPAPPAAMPGLLARCRNALGGAFGGASGGASGSSLGNSLGNSLDPKRSGARIATRPTVPATARSTRHHGSATATSASASASTAAHSRTDGLAAGSAATAEAREDWAAWARAMAGDADSADTLVRELGRSGLRLALQMLRSDAAAEDAVQEALLRLWRSPPQDRGTARLSTYFATLVLNVCRDALAQSRRETSTDPELLEAWQDGAAPEGIGAAWAAGPTAPGLDHGDRLDALATERQLADAVSSLPPRQRMAVALWAYADAPIADIARALDIDPNAAHQLLHRAKGALRARLPAALTE